MLDGMDDHAPIGGVATSVDDLSSDEREAYWNKVAETARTVFDLPDADAAVEGLRHRLGEASPQTQLFFFHRDPFQVAADLCQLRPVATTRQQNEAYLTMLRGAEDRGASDAGIPAQPRP